MIYYFNEYHLPYEFILPYEDKTFTEDVKEHKKETKKSLKVYKPDPNKEKARALQRHRKTKSTISQ